MIKSFTSQYFILIVKTQRLLWLTDIQAEFTVVCWRLFLKDFHNFRSKMRYYSKNIAVFFFLNLRFWGFILTPNFFNEWTKLMHILYVCNTHSLKWFSKEILEFYVKSSTWILFNYANERRKRLLQNWCDANSFNHEQTPDSAYYKWNMLNKPSVNLSNLYKVV